MTAPRAPDKKLPARIEGADADVDETPAVSVVLPAYNEAAGLAAVVERVLSALGAWSYEIIIVDDGSIDDTWQVIESLASAHPGVWGIRFTRNFGQQAALLAGLSAARGRVAITMDSDGQHPPELLPRFLDAWQSGAEVVQGLRRSTEKAGPFKRASSRVYYRVMNALAGVEILPGSTDFRLLSRVALEQVLASCGPLLFLRGLIPWLGLETTFVEFRAGRRLAGRSSYTFGRMLRLSIEGLLGFSIVPLRLAIGAGLIVSALAFLYLIYVVVVRLASGYWVPGWASVAGLLSLLGGIQLLTLGVLGEYIGRLFTANLQRPRYVVRQQSLRATGGS
jgi:polyisoprenyl-phosphate glycosyltransferase